MSNFQTVFCLSDKSCLMLIIKKEKKINLRVRLLVLKIAFVGGFGNDDILSSKSYTVKQKVQYLLNESSYLYDI